jgi:hypothetical protein
VQVGFHLGSLYLSKPRLSLTLYPGIFFTVTMQETKRLHVVDLATERMTRTTVDFQGDFHFEGRTADGHLVAWAHEFAIHHLDDTTGGTVAACPRFSVTRQPDSARRVGFPSRGNVSADPGDPLRIEPLIQERRG